MNQNKSGSCLRRRSSCLGNVCGTSIDLDNVRFSGSKSNLVYMDKVYSYNDATGCPLVVPISTCGANAKYFKATLALFQNSGNCGNNCGCGCGCNSGCGGGCGCGGCGCGGETALDSNAQFTVEDSSVLVELFELAPSSCICPAQVTVDGYPVDCVHQNDGQFFAETTNLISRIQKERCLEAGLPTKTFFLISNAGPFQLRVKFILTGTVNSGGRCSNFRLEIENAPNAPNLMLPHNRLSNFVINDLSLPCIIKGTAPVIRFQFGAMAQLQNPQLRVTCEGTGAGTPCEACACTVCLTSNLVIEPKVQAEVIRKTLFCVDGCEAMIPCQGSVEELLSEENEECPDPYAPDCFCGSGNVGGIGDNNGCGCSNNIHGDSGCGNNSCGNNGCGNNGCGSNGCGNNGCGNNGCGNNGCGNNGCGNNGCGNNSCGNNGCGNNGCGNNGCGNSGCGCGGHNPGIQPRLAPTMYQTNGCNGCSW